MVGFEQAPRYGTVQNRKDRKRESLEYKIYTNLLTSTTASPSAVAVTAGAGISVT